MSRNLFKFTSLMLVALLLIQFKWVWGSIGKRSLMIGFSDQFIFNSESFPGTPVFNVGDELWVCLSMNFDSRVKFMLFSPSGELKSVKFGSVNKRYRLHRFTKLDESGKWLIKAEVINPWRKFNITREILFRGPIKLKIMIDREITCLDKPYLLVKFKVESDFDLKLLILSELTGETRLDEEAGLKIRQIDPYLVEVSSSKPIKYAFLKYWCFSTENLRTVVNWLFTLNQGSINKSYELIRLPEGLIKLRLMSNESIKDFELVCLNGEVYSVISKRHLFRVFGNESTMLIPIGNSSIHLALLSLDSAKINGGFMNLTPSICIINFKNELTNEYLADLNVELGNISCSSSWLDKDLYVLLLKGPGEASISVKLDKSVEVYGFDMDPSKLVLEPGGRYLVRLRIAELRMRVLDEGWLVKNASVTFKRVIDGLKLIAGKFRLNGSMRVSAPVGAYIVEVEANELKRRFKLFINESKSIDLIIREPDERLTLMIILLGTFMLLVELILGTLWIKRALKVKLE